ncbi:hypothetical protein H5410_022586 [Solanum commersonii]|uniref:Uncharacterized protein n=1 Tax=Solanum commersonii TaxID=4109 RepID=A0A9J5ZEI7_SOLCO|nr:hypothetical protein H5410_022586 [Solanum commersonii]
MNLNQDIPDIQMVVSVPRILQDWWQNIRRIHGAEIQGHLGALLSLLGTQCDKVFVTQLMGFWEPSTSYGVPDQVQFYQHQHIADGYKHLQRSTKIYFGAYDPRRSSSFNDSLY